MLAETNAKIGHLRTTIVAGMTPIGELPSGASIVVLSTELDMMVTTAAHKRCVQVTIVEETAPFQVNLLPLILSSQAKVPIQVNLLPL